LEINKREFALDRRPESALSTHADAKSADHDPEIMIGARVVLEGGA
jgi:hypothetical protein